MATIEKKTKKLIISLIQDDLINTKLIYGLRELGINADDYILHLSEMVFELMGLEDSLQNDPIFNHYFKLAERVRFINLSNASQLQHLAEDLYEYLDMHKA